MDQASDTPHAPANTIAVSQFREVFQLPLVLDTQDMDCVTRLSDHFNADLARLNKRSAKNPWKPVDPVNYLPASTDTDGGPYGEFVYFHDFTQKFLYPESENVFSLFERKDIAGLKARMNGRCHHFDVERLTLHMFPIGVAMLTFEISWTSCDETERLFLSDCQTIIDYLRRSYTPFFNGTNPQRVPNAVELITRAQDIHEYRPQIRADVEKRIMHPKHNAYDKNTHRYVSEHSDALIFGHWCELISPLNLKVNGGRWRDPSDERIPCHSYISLTKDDDTTEAQTLLKIHDADWFRIADAEEPGEFGKYPYNPCFLRGIKRVAYYDRFFPHKDMPDYIAVRHLFGGAHYSAVGTGWFFDNILMHHFRRHYTQLALIARFQMAAMLSFSSQITCAVERRDRALARAKTTVKIHEDFAGDVLAIQDAFLTFTHRFYFTGVSSQLQPGEMYDRWKKVLGLEAVYAELKREIDSAVDSVRAHQNLSSAKNSEKLAAFAAFGVTGGLIVGTLGSNLLVEHAHTEVGYSQWQIVGAVIFLICGISTFLMGRLRMSWAAVGLGLLGLALGALLMSDVAPLPDWVAAKPPSR